MGISNAYIATTAQLGFYTWEKIAETTLTGAAASIQCNIPTGYKRLWFVASCIATGANASIYVKFNNDTTAAHYYYQNLYSAGAAVTGNSTSGTSSIIIGLFQTDEIAFGNCFIDNVAARIKSFTNTGGNHLRTELNSGYWVNTTDEISRIDVWTGNTTYKAGSVLTVWGCK